MPCQNKTKESILAFNNNVYYKSTLQLHPMFEYKLQGMWANDYESISLFRSIIQVLSKCYKVTVRESGGGQGEGSGFSS